MSEVNGINLVTVDITTVYVNVPCREKMAAVAGPEFGEYKSCAVIIEKALYGLKSSGAVWHAHLSVKLRAMGFIPSLVDPDM